MKKPQDKAKKQALINKLTPEQRLILNLLDRGWNLYSSMTAKNTYWLEGKNHDRVVHRKNFRALTARALITKKRTTSAVRSYKLTTT